ncbi:hypothetical protein AHAS_Ahas19G0064600 [Arachis hypogaea]
MELGGFEVEECEERGVRDSKEEKEWVWLGLAWFGDRESEMERKMKEWFLRFLKAQRQKEKNAALRNQNTSTDLLFSPPP